jgi:hypothetical protein
VPEEWIHYSKTFVCTHAGKYKPRGQGKRKRQESRALECDVQVCVVLSWAPLRSVPSRWVRLVYSRVLVGHSWAHVQFVSFRRSMRVCKWLIRLQRFLRLCCELRLPVWSTTIHSLDVRSTIIRTTGQRSSLR